MKKLCVWIILILVLTAMPIWLLGYAYKQTNTYKNLETNEETSKFHELPKSIDVAIFGSSHGRDSFRFMPEGKTAFNFSLSSQTPLYDLMLMREYKNHFHSETIVVLTVSYLSPFWEETEDAFVSKQPRYYRILSASNIVDVDFPKYALGRFSPVLTQDLSKIMSAIFDDELIISPIDETHQTSKQDMQSEKERIVRDHWQGIVEKSFPNPSQEMMKAYSEIFDLCKKNNWKVVMVTTPYLEEYHQCYPDGFYERFNTVVTEMSKEYQVDYYDFSHCDQFGSKYELFKNIDHLNLAGSEMFGKIFFSEIGL